MDEILETYYSNDALEDFEVKVTLRELNPTFSGNGDGNDDGGGGGRAVKSGRMQSRTFAWQEKVFGPAEIFKYTHPPTSSGALSRLELE